MMFLETNYKKSKNWDKNLTQLRNKEIKKDKN